VPANLTNVVAIAAGARHALAVKADGNVVAWGYNNSGQCTIPASATNAWDVAAGVDHSVALRKDGAVVCWGSNTHGECNVPAGLSNVVAIAASGDPTYGVSYYTLALQQDGNVVTWGSGEPLWPTTGLSNVIALGSGVHHVLGIRTGPKTPVVVLQPEDRYQLAGGNVTFQSRATGVYGVEYQWQHEGVGLPNETNATLTLLSVQATNEGAYRAVVSNEVGSVASSSANFSIVKAPIIISQTQPTNPTIVYHSNLTLSVVATASGQYSGFPIGYQWQFNGTNVPGANSSAYTVVANTNAGGVYSVLVTNAVGGTSATWDATFTFEGSYIGTNTLAFHLSTNALGYTAGYSGTYSDKHQVSG